VLRVKDPLTLIESPGHGTAETSWGREPPLPVPPYRSSPSFCGPARGADARACNVTRALRVCLQCTSRERESEREREREREKRGASSPLANSSFSLPPYDARPLRPVRATPSFILAEDSPSFLSLILYSSFFIFPVVRHRGLGHRRQRPEWHNTSRTGSLLDSRALVARLIFPIGPELRHTAVPLFLPSNASFFVPGSSSCSSSPSRRPRLSTLRRRHRRHRRSPTGDFASFLSPLPPIVRPPGLSGARRGVAYPIKESRPTPVCARAIRIAPLILSLSRVAAPSSPLLPLLSLPLRLTLPVISHLTPHLFS